MILVFAPLLYIIVVLVTLHFSIAAGAVLLAIGMVAGGSIAARWAA